MKNYFYELLPLLETLNLNKSSCEYYATWVSKAKVSQLMQMPNKNKLYFHLSAFAQHQFYARIDYLVDIFLKSVTAAKNKAKKKRVARDQAERGERLALIQQLVNEKEKNDFLIKQEKYPHYLTRIAKLFHCLVMRMALLTRRSLYIPIANEDVR